MSKSEQMDDPPDAKETALPETQQIWTTPTIRKIRAGFAEFNNVLSTDLNHLS